MKNMKIISLVFGLSLTANASALTLVDNDGFQYYIGDVIEQPNSFPLGPTIATDHYQAKCTVSGKPGSADCRLIFEPEFQTVSITTIENDIYFSWSCLGTWEGNGFDATCASSSGKTWNDRFSVLSVLPLSRSALGSDPDREK